jgi:anti-sigma B factor antagonist
MAADRECRCTTGTAARLADGPSASADHCTRPKRFGRLVRPIFGRSISVESEAHSMERNRGSRPDALRVGVERATDGSWLVTAAGELDRLTVARFTEALDLAAEGEPALVVLDITGCSFVDSTGLGALVAADKALRDAGSRLELAVSPLVLRLLQATGLDELLTVCVPPCDGEARGAEEACSGS